MIKKKFPFLILNSIITWQHSTQQTAPIIYEYQYMDFLMDSYSETEIGQFFAVAKESLMISMPFSDKKRDCF